MELTLVYTAKDGTEAMLLGGLLKSEGLHPTIPGSELNDEFAQGQRLAGTLGTEVWVPQDEAETAKDIVAAWQANKQDS